jgi:hypothetical protein
MTTLIFISLLIVCALIGVAVCALVILPAWIKSMRDKGEEFAKEKYSKPIPPRIIPPITYCGLFDCMRGKCRACKQNRKMGATKWSDWEL